MCTLLHSSSSSSGSSGSMLYVWFMTGNCSVHVFKVVARSQRLVVLVGVVVRQQSVAGCLSEPLRDTVRSAWTQCGMSPEGQQLTELMMSS